MWSSGDGPSVFGRVISMPCCDGADALHARDSSMAETISQRRTGIALVVAAAVAWSTAPFFTRLLHLDSWTILFWRGLFGGGLIAAVLVLMQGRGGLRDLFTIVS